MASSITSVEKVAYGAFRYTFSGTAPFTIVQDGLVVETDYNYTEYVVPNLNDNEEPPALEIFDSTEDFTTAETLAHSPYVHLQWYHEGLDGGYFLIEKNISTVWTEQAKVAHEYDGYQKWIGGPYADETTHEFRISAVDSETNTSTTVEYDLFLVRVPDPPSIQFSYASATNTLTISARS